jgi:hypothetical protein
MKREEFEQLYIEAREIVLELIGVSPENYVLSLFYDDDLFDSILLQTNHAGTPNAVISSNELELLQKIRDDDYIPKGKDLFYPSSKGRIYFPNRILELNKDAIKAKLVQLLAMSALCENSVSDFPKILQEVYRYDSIIHELFANNVYELIRERGAAWAWQYFQDFVATLRLLALYEEDEFYIPPGSVRNTSIFYNFLLEIKEITKKRAQAERRAPLFDLILQGFGHFVLSKYLTRFEEDELEEILPDLKSNLGQPFGELGKMFIEWNLEREENKDVNPFDFVISLKNDYELVKHWSRTETKKRVEETRENLMNKAVIWHGYKDGYWSDLWPLRANAFDRADEYVGKLQRRKYNSHINLLQDKPAVIAHGRVILRDKEVAVYTIQEETVGQEQLILLRNHLTAKKDEFVTPLPGLPDVIVFKKYAGMHVAKFIGVKKTSGYPKSPYDLPIVTRAIQVMRHRDAYVSEERDEDVKLSSTADYSKLKELTEPQHRAIRYLIRQTEVIQ